jgi:pSer/pThr/pTyr-binding forkhead associated (FHA) protein
MIECPSCGRQYRPGTLFCSECGVYLPAGGRLRTESVPEEELPTSRANPWATGAGEDEEDEKPTTLRIIISESGRQVQLPAAPEIYLGRLDAIHGLFPDLDLTVDGGPEGGVSRRHARILQEGNRFLIEDVGSANGTFLNGQRLTPYLPHPLQKGDKLQLGTLQLSVEFD